MGSDVHIRPFTRSGHIARWRAIFAFLMITRITAEARQPLQNFGRQSTFTGTRGGAEAGLQILNQVFEIPAESRSTAVMTGAPTLFTWTSVAVLSSRCSSQHNRSDRHSTLKPASISPSQGLVAQTKDRTHPRCLGRSHVHILVTAAQRCRGIDAMAYHRVIRL